MDASSERRRERGQGEIRVEPDCDPPVSWTLRAGLALILIGIAWFGGWAWWASTRIWVPLEVPISLAPGHTRTPEFTINVESTYSIEVTMRREFDVEAGHCFPGFGCPLDLAMSWSLWNDGRVLLRGGGTGSGGIGRFAAGKGRYALDVDVSQDGSRFNASEPHLAVVETGYQRERADYEGFRAFLALLVLGAVGVSLVIRSAVLRRQEKQDALIRACSLTQAGPRSPGSPTGAGLFRRAARSASVRVIHPASEGRYLGDPRPSSARPLSGLSSIALLAFQVFLVVNIGVGVMLCLEYPTPTGIMVRLLRPGISAQRSPGIQPLLVRVERHGRGLTHLYVNSQPVSLENLDSVLRKELGRRPPDWPAYVEGDRDMEWGDVLAVIDRLRGLHAGVVLLTSTATPAR